MMNKWIAIPVISVLVLGVIAVGYLYWQQTNKLGDAESEIVALEGNVTTLEGDVATLEGDVTTLEGNVSTLEGDVTTLEGNVSTLEGNVTTLEGEVSTLETDLADSEAEVSSVQSSLATANAKVSSQQTINSALSAQLKTVKDPRHFASVTELTDWLQQDDTDTQYASASDFQRAFILQVRALRDGYLIPASIYTDTSYIYVINRAVIGDYIYSVWSEDDYTERWEYIAPLPSHPLPLD